MSNEKIDIIKEGYSSKKEYLYHISIADLSFDMFTEILDTLSQRVEIDEEPVLEDDAIKEEEDSVVAPVKSQDDEEEIIEEYADDKKTSKKKTKKKVPSAAHEGEKYTDEGFEVRENRDDYKRDFTPEPQSEVEVSGVKHGEDNIAKVSYYGAETFASNKLEEVKAENSQYSSEETSVNKEKIHRETKDRTYDKPVTENQGKPSEKPHTEPSAEKTYEGPAVQSDTSYTVPETKNYTSGASVGEAASYQDYYESKNAEPFQTKYEAEGEQENQRQQEIKNGYEAQKSAEELRSFNKDGTVNFGSQVNSAGQPEVSEKQEDKVSVSDSQSISNESVGYAAERKTASEVYSVPLKDKSYISFEVIKEKTSETTGTEDIYDTYERRMNVAYATQDVVMSQAAITNIIAAAQDKCGEGESLRVVLHAEGKQDKVLYQQTDTPLKDSSSEENADDFYGKLGNVSEAYYTGMGVEIPPEPVTDIEKKAQKARDNIALAAVGVHSEDFRFYTPPSDKTTVTGEKLTENLSVSVRSGELKTEKIDSISVTPKDVAPKVLVLPAGVSYISPSLLREYQKQGIHYISSYKGDIIDIDSVISVSTGQYKVQVDVASDNQGKRLEDLWDSGPDNAVAEMKGPAAYNNINYSIALSILNNPNIPPTEKLWAISAFKKENDNQVDLRAFYEDDFFTKQAHLQSVYEEETSKSTLIQKIYGTGEISDDSLDSELHITRSSSKKTDLIKDAAVVAALLKPSGSDIKQKNKGQREPLGTGEDFDPGKFGKPIHKVDKTLKKEISPSSPIIQITKKRKNGVSKIFSTVDSHGHASWREVYEDGSVSNVRVIGYGDELENELSEEEKEQNKALMQILEDNVLDAEMQAKEKTWTEVQRSDFRRNQNANRALGYVTRGMSRTASKTLVGEGFSYLFGYGSLLGTLSDFTLQGSIQEKLDNLHTSFVSRFSPVSEIRTAAGDVATIELATFTGRLRTRRKLESASRTAFSGVNITRFSTHQLKEMLKTGKMNGQVLSEEQLELVKATLALTGADLQDFDQFDPVEFFKKKNLKLRAPVNHQALAAARQNLAGIYSEIGTAANLSELSSFFGDGKTFESITDTELENLLARDDLSSEFRDSLEKMQQGRRKVNDSRYRKYDFTNLRDVEIYLNNLSLILDSENFQNEIAGILGRRASLNTLTNAEIDLLLADETISEGLRTVLTETKAAREYYSEKSKLESENPGKFSIKSKIRFWVRKTFSGDVTYSGFMFLTSFPRTVRAMKALLTAFSDMFASSREAFVRHAGKGIFGRTKIYKRASQREAKRAAKVAKAKEAAAEKVRLKKQTSFWRKDRKPQIKKITKKITRKPKAAIRKVVSNSRIGKIIRKPGMRLLKERLSLAKNFTKKIMTKVLAPFIGTVNLVNKAKTMLYKKLLLPVLKAALILFAVVVICNAGLCAMALAFDAVYGFIFDVVDDSTTEYYAEGDGENKSIHAANTLAGDRVNICLFNDNVWRYYTESFYGNKSVLDAVSLNPNPDNIKEANEKLTENWVYLPPDENNHHKGNLDKFRLQSIGQTINGIQTGIHYSYMDGDGNEIAYTSNAKDIVAAANMYMGQDFNIKGLYKSYVEKLWNYSHIVGYSPRKQPDDNYIYACDSHNSVSECYNNSHVYYCNENKDIYKDKLVNPNILNGMDSYNKRNPSKENNVMLGTKTDYQDLSKFNGATEYNGGYVRTHKDGIFVDYYSKEADSTDGSFIWPYNKNGCDLHLFNYNHGNSNDVTSQVLASKASSYSVHFDNKATTKPNGTDGTVKLYSSANGCSNPGSFTYTVLIDKDGKYTTPEKKNAVGTQTKTAYYCKGEDVDSNNKCEEEKSKNFDITINKSTYHTAQNDKDISQTCNDFRRCAEKENVELECGHVKTCSSSELSACAHKLTHDDIEVRAGDCDSHNEYDSEESITLKDTSTKQYVTNRGKEINHYLGNSKPSNCGNYGTVTAKYQTITKEQVPRTTYHNSNGSFNSCSSCWSYTYTKEVNSYVADCINGRHYCKITASDGTSKTVYWPCSNWDSSTQKCKGRCPTHKITYTLYYCEGHTTYHTETSYGPIQTETLYFCKGHCSGHCLGHCLGHCNGHTSEDEQTISLNYCEGYCNGHCLEHYCNGHVDLDITAVTLFADDNNSLLKLGAAKEADYKKKEYYNSSYVTRKLASGIGLDDIATSITTEDVFDKTDAKTSVYEGGTYNYLYSPVNKFTTIDYSKYPLPKIDKVLETTDVSLSGFSNAFIMDTGNFGDAFDTVKWLPAEHDSLNNPANNNMDNLIKYLFMSFETEPWQDHNDTLSISWSGITNMPGIKSKFKTSGVIEKDKNHLFDGWLQYKFYPDSDTEGKAKLRLINNAPVYSDDAERVFETLKEDWYETYLIQFPGAYNQMPGDKEVNRMITTARVYHDNNLLGTSPTGLKKLIESVGSSYSGNVFDFVANYYRTIKQEINSLNANKLSNLNSVVTASKNWSTYTDSKTGKKIYGSQGEYIYKNILKGDPNKIGYPLGKGKDDYADANKNICNLKPGDIIGIGDEAFVVVYNECYYYYNNGRKAVAGEKGDNGAFSSGNAGLSVEYGKVVVATLNGGDSKEIGQTVHLFSLTGQYLQQKNNLFWYFN